MMEPKPELEPELGLSLTRPHRKLAAKGANGINFICMLCVCVCVWIFA